MVRVTEPAAWAARLRLGLTLKVTPVLLVVVMAKVKDFELPLRFVTPRVKVRVWPEPNGTEPKLTLTGLRATAAVTAESRFSRPAPIILTSGCRAVLVNIFRTP